MAESRVLPVLPLRDIVVYPKMAAPLFVGREKSVRALDECSAISISAANLYKVYAHDLKQFALIQMNMGREVSRRLREADNRLFGVTAQIAWTPKPSYQLTLRTPLGDNQVFEWSTQLNYQDLDHPLSKNYAAVSVRRHGYTQPRTFGCLGSR